MSYTSMVYHSILPDLRQFLLEDLLGALRNKERVTPFSKQLCPRQKQLTPFSLLFSSKHLIYKMWHIFQLVWSLVFLASTGSFQQIDRWFASFIAWLIGHLLGHIDEPPSPFSDGNLHGPVQDKYLHEFLGCWMKSQSTHLTWHINEVPFLSHCRIWWTTTWTSSLSRSAGVYLSIGLRLKGITFYSSLKGFNFRKSTESAQDSCGIYSSVYIGASHRHLDIVWREAKSSLYDFTSASSSSNCQKQRK